MSAPDDSDGTKGSKTKPEAENEEGQETVAAGAEKKAPTGKETDATEKKRPSKKSPRKPPELTAGKKPAGETKSGADTPPNKGAKPASRRRWALVAALLAFVLVGGPGLFLLCLSQSDTAIEASLSPTGAPVACTPVAGHFNDCYLSEEVTVSTPDAPPKSGFEQFCCDFIVERQIPIAAHYSDGSGAVPNTLEADGTELPLADGTRRTGRPVLHDGSDLQRRLHLAATPQFTVPAIEILEGSLGVTVPFDVGKMIATLSPKAAARSEMDRDVPLTEGGTIVRISSASGGQTQISVRARTKTSLLFEDLLSGGIAAEDILMSADLPAASDGALIERIDSLAPAGHGDIRSAFAALRQISVSRHPEQDEDAAVLQAAGRACVGFYEALRGKFNRYDAAVAAYAAARPTGLLTSRSPEDPHGCRDAGRAALSAELAADWATLNAPFVEIAPPPVEPAPEPEAATSPSGEENVRKLLLSLASTAKSGARLQDMKAAIADPVAVSFARDGEANSGSREAVIRMLHRQWSHVGCWIYSAGPDGSGSAMLLAEAQYPYLNRIMLGFDTSGQVKRVQVTGVTFDDLIRFKAANRGDDCQDFLNPARLADYRDWYAENPVGTPTPSDHAERLFHEGLQQKFRLN
ncbi:hypothetical protein NUH88_15165 [Nisaea acidiphila]|uniref:Uncharacterized protein n=1 Tax=Nisaea acidiphila TaxID=1862145 RepID=A0A9J7ATP4_9PROT|nr:hypothetical protein [Nisaea acidiphila]UUX48741.1 hypothetical protein NUH88_15165 [Nisaea acidiphila]